MSARAIGHGNCVGRSSAKQRSATMALLQAIIPGRPRMNALVHRPLARRRLDAIARIASPKTVLPLALATSWALRHHRGALRLAVGTTLGIVGEEIIKRLVHRHRPRLFDGTAWRSFPSGHSAGATAYLLGLASLVPRRSRPLVLGF